MERPNSCVANYYADGMESVEPWPGLVEPWRMRGCIVSLVKCCFQFLCCLVVISIYIYVIHVYFFLLGVCFLKEDGTLK